MTAHDFLKETLKKWVSRFEGIKLKYAYDAVTEYHIVEVEPEAIRRGSADYKKAEMALWMGFMEQYPDECLLICAPSEANDMSNVLYSNESAAKVIKLKETFSGYYDYNQSYCYSYTNIEETSVYNTDYALAA